MRHLPALIPAALLMALAAQTGLTESLGAHPWWAAQVILLGAPAGLLLAALAALSGLAAGPRIILFALIAAAAFAAATWGKAEFAASYAENVMAGRLWFLGWIGTAAGAAALLAALTSLAYPGRARG
ncbi:MAG: hypothetical protein P1U75_13225 [Antarcticimicrobium sp.]|uniref:hypothetical protein n=1 Tax=Antarcticimicrobium sp. TaxID=2824147 RepID=UPI002622C59C|nr:hypothetical protein [Antarcticimicrobium sp.]MDF1717616.1 hypothetical protein [Antarcticimicrobium sp.]